MPQGERLDEPERERFWQPLACAFSARFKSSRLIDALSRAKVRMLCRG